MAGIEKQAIGGLREFLIDGVPYAASNTITSSLDTIERESVAKAGGGGAGYKVTPRVPFIEVELLTTPALDIEAIKDVTDSNVVARLYNGKTYSLENAWQVGALEPNLADGTVTARFEGVRGRVVELGNA